MFTAVHDTGSSGEIADLVRSRTTHTGTPVHCNGHAPNGYPSHTYMEDSGNAMQLAKLTSSRSVGVPHGFKPETSPVSDNGRRWEGFGRRAEP